MLVNNQKIKVKWNVRNKKHYIDKGYIFSKIGTEFEVLVTDLPDNSSYNITVICDYCCKESNVKYCNYLKSYKQYGNYYCCHCTQKRYLSERRNNYFNKITDFCTNYNYTLLSRKNDIFSRESKIKYICSEHGEQITTVTSILQNKKCYKCSRKDALIKKSKTTLDERRNNLYISLLNSCKEKGYILKTEKEQLNGIKNTIIYICPEHGEQQMKAYNFMSGKGCPKCVGINHRKRFQLSPDEVEQRILKYRGVLLNKNEYINQAEKNLKIICPECRSIFTSSLRNFTQHKGQVCEFCSNKESQGERKIRHYLENNSIYFEQEKWFEGCRDTNPLPFDFYLPDYNCIIEYDGKQHFDDRGYNSGKFSDSLEYTLLHDQIKNNYCEQENIQLIRIPYWEYDNIDTILNKKLFYLKI